MEEWRAWTIEDWGIWEWRDMEKRKFLKWDVHIGIFVCRDECLPRLSYEICKTKNEWILNFHNSSCSKHYTIPENGELLSENKNVIAFKGT